MARQARSEVTRRRLLDAAVDLFSETGFAATSLGEIIERAALTKGALYHHFDSKEAVAAAIIADAAAMVADAVGRISQSAAPALENLIHSSFVVAGVVTGVKSARTGAQLARTLGEFNPVTTQSYEMMLELISTQTVQAAAEGDLRVGVDPSMVGEVLLSIYLGAEQLSMGVSGGQDLIHRITRAWDILLPAVAADDALPYFREFLARQALRDLPTPTGD